MGRLPGPRPHPRPGSRALRPSAEDPRRHPSRGTRHPRPRPRRPRHGLGRHLPHLPQQQIRPPPGRESPAQGDRALRLPGPGHARLRRDPRPPDAPRPGAPDVHRTRGGAGPQQPGRPRTGQVDGAPPGAGGRPCLRGRSRQLRRSARRFPRCTRRLAQVAAPRRKHLCGARVPDPAHRAHPRAAGENSWTVAGYESPVSDRMWHLAFPDTTPEPVVRTLLDSLASGDHDLALGSPITAKTVAQAIAPLTQAGWENTIDGRCIRWASPHAGVQLDTFAAQNPYLNPTWLIWAGPDPQQATWVVHASAYTPAQVLTELVECLAPELGQVNDSPTTRGFSHPLEASVTLPAAPTAIKAPPGRQP
ncbi:DUF317 domain-containing protein [Streptomyces sp. DT224]|uniref:DUF317 domain-containing protein n=1 Tax=Streptomyces sp. DT224 TaxID=3393426 RepID=UPI003CF307B8